MGSLIITKSLGSLPLEVDYKRQLRAEQWARFCGRHSCAELIEKWARTRNLDKDPLFANKDQDINSGMCRARANSTIQTISKEHMPSLKGDKGNFNNELIFFLSFRSMIKILKL